MDHQPRVVFVELEVSGSASPLQTFELALADRPPDKSDLKQVVDGMVLKKPSMKDVLRSGQLNFKVASTHFPDRFVDVGEESPLKHGCSLRCLVTKVPQMANLDYPATNQLGKHLPFLLHLHPLKF